MAMAGLIHFSFLDDTTRITAKYVDIVFLSICVFGLILSEIVGRAIY